MWRPSLLLMLVGALLADGGAHAEPVVIRGGTRVISSADAVPDSSAAAPDRRITASADAPLYSWEGGAAGDAWYNRPIRDYRDPAPESAYERRRRTWADTMWFMVFLDRYNRRCGMPLGVGFSRWVDGWRGQPGGPAPRPPGPGRPPRD
jgi:hypothetical protein